MMSTFLAMSGTLTDVRYLDRHLLVAGIKEVDHPRGEDGDFTKRFGGADDLGFEEVAGTAQHGFSPSKS